MIHVEKYLKYIWNSKKLHNIYTHRDLCGLSPQYFYTDIQGGTSVVVPYCYSFLLPVFVFILWFSYSVSDIFCKF